MSLILFTEDTILLFRNYSYGQQLRTCNSEIIKFRKWTICNRLPLNIDKTYLLTVSIRKILFNLIFSMGKCFCLLKENGYF